MFSCLDLILTLSRDNSALAWSAFVPMALVTLVSLAAAALIPADEAAARAVVLAAGVIALVGVQQAAAARLGAGITGATVCTTRCVRFLALQVTTNKIDLYLRPMKFHKK